MRAATLASCIATVFIVLVLGPTAAHAHEPSR